MGPPSSLHFFNFTIDTTSFWFWYFVGITPVLVFIIIWSLPQIINYQKMKRQSFLDSLENGAIDEPQMVRKMTDIERQSFQNKLRQQMIYMTFGFGICSIMAVLLFYSFLHSKDTYPLLVEVIVVPGLLFFLWQMTQMYHYEYIDKRSPVFRVKGPILFEGRSRYSQYHNKKRKIENVVFLVRAIRFSLLTDIDENGESEGEAGKLIRSIKDGDIVTIDYTPFLKQVLHIQKG